jgi:hypothetical protein
MQHHKKPTMPTLEVPKDLLVGGGEMSAIQVGKIAWINFQKIFHRFAKL